MPEPLRSPDPELRELRHRYNRLCARFPEVATADPALLARAVQELQDLSDRIAALEAEAERATGVARRIDAAEPAGPDRPKGAVANAPVETPRRNPPPSEEGEPTADIVLFRVLSAATDGGGLADPNGPSAPALRPTETARGAAGASASRGGLARQDIPEDRFDPFSRPETGEPGRGSEPSQRDLGRILAAIERQREAVERCLLERDPAKALIPQLEALNVAVEQQRQRITALAVALQSLLQWLVAERQQRKD